MIRVQMTRGGRLIVGLVTVVTEDSGHFGQIGVQVFVWNFETREVYTYFHFNKLKRGHRQSLKRMIIKKTLDWIHPHKEDCVEDLRSGVDCLHRKVVV